MRWRRGWRFGSKGMAQKHEVMAENSGHYLSGCSEHEAAGRLLAQQLEGAKMSLAIDWQQVGIIIGLLALIVLLYLWITKT